MTWTHDDPAQGSPAAVQGLAQLRTARAGKIRDAQRSLQAAGSGSGAEWKAMSQSAFASKLCEGAADIELLATGLEAQASALQTYAGQLSQLQDRQRVLEQQRSSVQMDLGLAKTKLRTSDAELPALLRAETPDLDATAAAKRKSAAAQTAVDDAQAKSWAIDAQWEQLLADRRSVDSTCASALQGADALGNLAGVSTSSIAASSPTALLAMVGRLSTIDLKILLKQHPELAGALAKSAPSEVAKWWASLPGDQQAALVAGLPAVVGALDGVPALARVAANKINAAERLNVVQDEIEHLQRLASDAGSPDRFFNQISALEDERAYLQSATGSHPTVQLYLYDHNKDRIIEMIGTPSADTSKVVTYTPGTLANLQQFYDGNTQAIADWLQKKDENGLVAFVYKDGRSPQNPLTEANDQDYAKETGRHLARFEDGLFNDPLLAGAKSIAIGHSWGTANITSSEVAGARYDDVVSISGAGAPATWVQRSGTRYVDFSYDDILQTAQGIRVGDDGGVWSGRNPRYIGFEHGDYYHAPANWKVVAGEAVGAWPLRLAAGVDSHNLAATVEPANMDLINDMRNYIYDKRIQ